MEPSPEDCGNPDCPWCSGCDYLDCPNLPGRGGGPARNWLWRWATILLAVCAVKVSEWITN